jgi:hypothetical protein
MLGEETNVIPLEHVIKGSAVAIIVEINLHECPRIRT